MERESESGEMALPSPRDARDWVLENLGASRTTGNPLPEEYIMDYVDDAFDQGDKYTCGACVGALLAEINIIKQSPESYVNIPHPRLSSDFIYYHRLNKPSNGMFGRDVFSIMKHVGVATEKLYRSFNISPRKAYKDATARKITGYVTLTTSDALQRALCDIGPAYILLPYYSRSTRFWMKTHASNYRHGYHAVAVIGYNRDGFIIMNSWGNDWGINGRALLGYEFWHLVQEVWVPIYNAAVTNIDKKIGLLKHSRHMYSDPAVEVSSGSSESFSFSPSQTCSMS